MLVFLALGNAKELYLALGDAKVPNANDFASQWNTCIGLTLGIFSLLFYHFQYQYEKLYAAARVSLNVNQSFHTQFTDGIYDGVPAS